MMAIKKQENRMSKAISLEPNLQEALADGTVASDELRQCILSMKLPQESLRPVLLEVIEAAILQSDRRPGGSVMKRKKQ